MKLFFQTIYSDLKNVILSPSDFFEESEKKDIGSSAKFAASMGAILGSFYAFIGLISMVVAPIEGVTVFFQSQAMNVLIFIAMPLVFAVSAVIGAFINAGLMHLVAYFAGLRGFDRTFAAYSYSLATSVAAWIPGVNLLAGLYGLYIQVVGIKELHNASTGKALLVVLTIPILTALIYIAVISALIVMAGPEIITEIEAASDY